MKYLNGKYYVRKKDERFVIHPDEAIILRDLKRPKFLRTQIQVNSDTKIRKNQKVIKMKNAK